MRYRADLDGLRALAVVPVVVFHAFPARLPGGFVGVDIFFVISGFLITEILARECDEGTFSVLRFYQRRIRRIFPALLVVLAATLAFGQVALLPDERAELSKHVAAGAAFVSNIVLYGEVGYFDRAAELKPLLHLWSLGVEEQFYIVWPLALWLLHRAKLLLPGAGAFLLLSLGYGLFETLRSPPAAFYLLPSRFWELAAGAVLALALRRPDRAPALGPAVADAAGFAGILLIAASMAFLSSRSPFPGWRAIAPVLGAVLLIGAGAGGWVNRQVLSRKALVWVGLISYPLYLWHWPIMAYLRVLDPLPTPRGQRLLMLAAIAAAVLLSWATYRFVERPIRSGPVRWRVPALATAMVLLAAAGLASRRAAYIALAGFENPLAWGDARFNSPGCNERFGLTGEPLPFCVETQPGAAPRILVIGDSHANHWVPGIAAANPGVPILQVGGGACLPFPGLESFSILDDAAHQALCGRAMKRAFELLGENPQIDRVYLAMRSTRHLPGEAYGSLNVDADRVLADPAAPALTTEQNYERGLRNAIAMAKAGGRAVAVVLQAPEMGFDPLTCVHLRSIAFRSVREPCSEPRQAVEKRQARYRAIVKRVAADEPQVKIDDPMTVACDAGQCRGMAGDVLLYRNSDHLSLAGSRRIWQDMVDARARQARATGGEQQESGVAPP